MLKTDNKATFCTTRARYLFKKPARRDEGYKSSLFDLVDGWNRLAKCKTKSVKSN